jgi:uncharacterized protein (DUF1697 family)
MGFSSAKTILATGNIVFYSDSSDIVALTEIIESGLEKIFGFSVSMTVRTIEDMRTLLKSDPFRGIKITADTRLYVTFLSESHGSTIKLPYTSPDKEFYILKANDSEVISVLHLGKDTRTVEVMAIMEKEFGKHITTRNWNTIVRVVEG